MRLIAYIFFWFGVFTIFYTYVGYPALLALLNHWLGRRVDRSAYEPSVSFVITAYNEERDLAAKLENTLSLDYPKDRLEVIVASDCSSDGTDQIVREFASRGVRLHRQAQRLGKTAAQNAAVELAKGEIVLFSDATTYYQEDVLRVLMRSFADPNVGCATGRVAYANKGESSIGHGTRSYWSYEFLLKSYESNLCSLIGVCGCMYAVRRIAYIPLYHEACSDFVIATKMVEQGLRAVYEPDAVCIEETNQEAEKEFKTRVRIITQTLSDLWRNRSMMNPLRSGFFAIELLSHKLMRYLIPLSLLSILISSILLSRSSLLFGGLLIIQVCFYGFALLAWAFERIGWHNRLLAIPQYFLLTNVASIIAFYKFFKGERYVRWEPIRTGAEEGAQ